MDLTLLHPKVVHLPIALAILMPLVSGGLLLAWWRKWLPRRAWYLAVLFQILLVVSGFAALQTGEADEDPVEKVVAERHIDSHEEAAEQFEWAGAVVLLLLLGAGLLPNEKGAIGLAGVAALGTVVVLAMGVRVGESGGALVYEHGAANAFIDSGATAANTQTRSNLGHEDDDDD